VSGLSAAHTIYLAGGNVIVLDKQGKQLFMLRAVPGVLEPFARVPVAKPAPDINHTLLNHPLTSDLI
jgi:hypothetical protein